MLGSIHFAAPSAALQLRRTNMIPAKQLTELNELALVTLYFHASIPAVLQRLIPKRIVKSLLSFHSTGTKSLCKFFYCCSTAVHLGGNKIDKETSIKGKRIALALSFILKRTVLSPLR